VKMFQFIQQITLIYKQRITIRTLEHAWCFMEWPEKIDNLLPENTVSVYIKSK